MFSRLACVSSIAVLLAIAPSFSVCSQSIVPADDGIGTTVTPNGDRFDIQGGSLSEDNANLFHSFEQFNLEIDRTANFIANPNIRNILTRVTGGNASYIDGLIKLSGSNANLYFMNPAGILFGQQARLNVPGDFFATTATGICFDSGWFDALQTSFQTQNVANLTGNPNAFEFALPQIGAIVNEGNLAVTANRNLALLGGAVANTGLLSAPGGTVMLTAVSGPQLLRFSVPGNLLSLEIAPTAVSDVPFNPLGLPELLTGGGVDRASRLTVNPDGTVSLRGSTVSVSSASGTAIVSGSIEASDGVASGEIGLFGDRIAVDAATLNTSGTTPNPGRLLFQATNDILLSSSIDNPDGIELYAGRSINIDANLNTSRGNGDIVLFANESVAAADSRQPGPASIFQSSGTEIRTSSGNVLLRMGNAGEIGEIRLGTITSNRQVEIDANSGPIFRNEPNAQVTADVGIFRTMGTGGIGTPNAPIRVSLNTLQVQTGSGGQFFSVVGGRRQTIEEDVSRDIEGDVRVDEIGDKPDAPEQDAPGEFEGFDDAEGDRGEFDDRPDDGERPEIDDDRGEFDDRPDDGERPEFDDRPDDGERPERQDEGDEPRDDDDGDRGEIEDEEFDFEFTEGAEIAYTEDVEAVASLEQDRLQEFSTYLGNLANSSISIQSAREALTEVARQTGTQSAVVYVTLLPNQLELVVFTANNRPIRRSVSVSRSQVLEVANRFREQLTNPRYIRTTAYLESAQQLYQWSIAPILPELEAAEIDTLLFSMPAGLRSLPIAALHDGEHFLVEQFSLSLIPSLGLVDTRYRTLQNTSVLAMGASEFNTDLAPLPAVPVELTTITQEWWNGTAFLNEQFTRENLVQQRRRHGYAIVHLATHGEFLTFEDSYIQLWDERLRLDQLRRLGWNNPAVELVVLSACRTAVGSEEAELGFAGFAVSAGVKSALASLWYVSDEGTLGLMSQFYRQLRETRTKSEALRQAQLALIHGDVRVESGSVRIRGVAEPLALPEELQDRSNLDLSHPYYWAGFTMVGSPW
ncbi:CHAT domain-containing protein [Baaleninema sp.]|uniref:CHAT domain-containing protein n=1 Tax=Baaleninema sp. TaxID=3101197 RepID=UPI003D01659B